ncbi:methylated-DNA--[protein]-cysteine S-methyltransferase [Sulfuriferula sp. GW1]|uniref:methylated-DNA--[protein]-cysteine S-methyltransferase n=1 Tax=Sulfuriferula sp. GW1 TaxID=3345111 RepID=UPI0039B11D47
MRNTVADQARQYETVARAITFIRSHARRQPTLHEISDSLGLSEFHLQRMFSEWAGVSPKRFLQYVTKQYAKQALRESADVLSVTLDTGLSSPGRLHDLMVTCEAMSPGEIKTGGAGLEIGFGEAPTPFGNALIAWTSRGICHLGFVEGAGMAHAVAGLQQDWPAATLVQDRQRALQLAAEIFHAGPPTQALHLMLRGSNFQIKVWEALLSVAPGEMVSYTQLAQRSGTPKARRSVATAIAKNSIALLIPCHRVIRESGEIGSYRWGSDRKTALLAWEAAQVAR